MNEESRFVNEESRFVNEESRFVNEESRFVNEESRFVNEESRFVVNIVEHEGELEVKVGPLETFAANDETLVGDQLETAKEASAGELMAPLIAPLIALLRASLIASPSHPRGACRSAFLDCLPHRMIASLIA
jgi:hypothetical protein